MPLALCDLANAVYSPRTIPHTSLAFSQGQLVPSGVGQLSLRRQ